MQLPGSLWQPARVPCSSFLGLGSLSAPEAASSQDQHPLQGTSQAPVDAALPAGCWAEPLPPLHRPKPLIPVLAEAVGRLQEVRHPSLCCLG